MHCADVEQTLCCSVYNLVSSLHIYCILHVCARPQDMLYVWTEPKLCIGGVALPEKKTVACESMDYWVRLGAGMATFTAVLLISLTCYFWKKNKRYQNSLFFILLHFALLIPSLVFLFFFHFIFFPLSFFLLSSFLLSHLSFVFLLCGHFSFSVLILCLFLCKGWSTNTPAWLCLLIRNVICRWLTAAP